MFTDLQNLQNVFAAVDGAGPGIFNVRGNWNADTNTPTLVNGGQGGNPPTVDAGDLYIVNVAGTTSLDGIIDWQVGDFAVSTGTQWLKIDNTQAAVSLQKAYTDGANGNIILDPGGTKPIVISSDITMNNVGPNVLSVSGTTGFLGITTMNSTQRGLVAGTPSRGSLNMNTDTAGAERLEVYRNTTPDGWLPIALEQTPVVFDSVEVNAVGGSDWDTQITRPAGIEISNLADTENLCLIGTKIVHDGALALEFVDTKGFLFTGPEATFAKIFSPFFNTGPITAGQTQIEISKNPGGIFLDDFTGNNSLKIDQTGFTSTGTSAGFTAVTPDFLIDTGAGANISYLFNATSLLIEDDDATQQVNIDNASISSSGDFTIDNFGQSLQVNALDVTNTITNFFEIEAGAAGNVTIDFTLKDLMLLTSTVGFFVPTRMTVAQRNAVVSPTAGAINYDSDTDKLSYYNGSAWITSAVGIDTLQDAFDAGDGSITVNPGVKDLVIKDSPLTNTLTISNAKVTSTNSFEFDAPGFTFTATNGVLIDTGAGGNISTLINGNGLFIADDPLTQQLTIDNVSIQSSGDITITTTPDNIIFDAKKVRHTSTTGGLQLANMTALERDGIVGPLTGEMVYSTNDDRPYFYNGATWQSALSIETLQDGFDNGNGSIIVNPGIKDLIIKNAPLTQQLTISHDSLESDGDFNIEAVGNAINIKANSTLFDFTANPNDVDFLIDNTGLLLLDNDATQQLNIDNTSISSNGDITVTTGDKLIVDATTLELSTNNKVTVSDTGPTHLSVNGTTGVLKLSVLTDPQISALTAPEDGSLVYNSTPTVGVLQYRRNGVWQKIPVAGGDETFQSITVDDATGVDLTLDGAGIQISDDPVTHTLSINDNSISLDTGTLEIEADSINLKPGSNILTFNGGNFFNAVAPTTIKGDIVVHNGTTNVRLAGGTNGQVLSADSLEATGLKWQNNFCQNMFVSTQFVQVTNTVTETTVIGTIVGSKVIPANSLAVGSTIKIRITGCYQSLDNSQTVRIRIKFGSAVVADTVSLTPLPEFVGSDQLMTIECDITIRATGGAGVAISRSGGKLTVKDASPYETFVYSLGLTNTSTLNTTVANTIDVTAQWGAASVSNQFETETILVERYR